MRYIVSLLLMTAFCWQPVMAQGDIEMTDSTSTDWGDNIGGGLLPDLPTGPVTSLTLSMTDITLDGGDRFRLAAHTNITAANKAVTWSVADKKIAIVSNNGTVTGLKTGSTIVTATSVSNPDISACCKVTVVSDYVAPSSGWILPWGREEAWTMKYKFFEQANYVEPSNDVSGRSWKELDYDDTSWETLKGPMGRSDNCNYYWEGENNCFCLRRTFFLPVVGNGFYTFHANHDDGIEVYMNGRLVAEYNDWTQDQDVVYEIPNEALTAGENQLAIYIKQGGGGACLDYGLYYEKIEPVTELTLSSSELTLKMGEYAKLKATANESAYDKSVTWSVANNAVAIVLPSGAVKGVKTGTTLVTATSVSNPEVSASCMVAVTSESAEQRGLPDVPFEFFFDAANYDANTQSIPNHMASNLCDFSLQLSQSVPDFNGEHLTLNERCEGFIDRWEKGSTESGDYFHRSGQDNMTIVCKVKPKRNSGNAMDFVTNRADGWNYMFRVGESNKLFLHTGTAYEDGRALNLPDDDKPQILSVRVNGAEDYIQLDNLTTGESVKVYGVNWGGGNNVMKFFYNNDSEYWMGDFYWMYYSFECLTDAQLNAFGSTELQLNLKEGWNWISSNIRGIQSVRDFIRPIEERVDRFVGFETECIKDPVYGFVGQLNNIEPSSQYMVFANSDVKNVWNGFAYPSSEVLISLQPGWNWIGFVPTYSMPLEEALTNLSPTEGDVIKNYEDFSVYHDGQWEGTLTDMKPGEGYMYYSSQATEFYYPSALDKTVIANKILIRNQHVLQKELQNPWSVVRHKYPHNMTVIAELDKFHDADNNYVVAAFVGNECRGIGKKVNHKLFMTIYGDVASGDMVTFKAYNSATKEVFEIAQTCSFAPVMVGSVAKPFKLTARNHTQLENLSGTSHFQISVNPVQSTLFITGNLQSVNKVSVISAGGVLVGETDCISEHGLPVSHLPSGIYFVVLHTREGTKVLKMLKT